MGPRAPGQSERRLTIVEIRELRPDEYETAGEVTVHAWEEFYGEDLGYYADKLREIGDRAKDAVLLAAFEGEEIVGTVTYVPDASSRSAVLLRDDEAQIRMLSVSPSHKRRGIGRALSLACIERARAAGKRAVVLHADQIMDASQRLYESLGFTRDPERDLQADEQTFVLCYVYSL